LVQPWIVILVPLERSFDCSGLGRLRQRATRRPELLQIPPQPLPIHPKISGHLSDRTTRLNRRRNRPLDQLLWILTRSSHHRRISTPQGQIVPDSEPPRNAVQLTVAHFPTGANGTHFKGADRPAGQCGLLSVLSGSCVRRVSRAGLDPSPTSADRSKVRR